MTLGFETVLVADRGEIACRIMRTAARLGLRTVAVYSDADAAAPHVRMADTAVRLGPGPAAQSYQCGDRVIEAALATGAGAIHPGYGFLAEDADFAARVERAAIAYVGPTATQLAVFGNKHSAREAARAVSVPVVAGSRPVTSADQAAIEAEVMGFPVMLKPVGGGGGIGMRACFTVDEVYAAADRIVGAARAGGGAKGVIVEKLIPRARHVEVQIFGDGRGRAVDLGTRDCSLQRRHQKVVEEAPAPGLPRDLVDRLLTSSRDLVRSVDYRSAATVEFLWNVDAAEASFLEVNPRLQVEHPVTEAVTGIDLVEWMLRLSGGDTAMFDEFPDSSAAVTGWAVEARVYAEDPARGYRPSTGLITDVELPDGVRVDTWISRGTCVSPYYDPLIAKVITAGDDRGQAFDALAVALQETRVHGIETNLAQLRAALTDPRVRSAQHTTSTLDDIIPAGRHIEVLQSGTLTTIQDHPGRVGLWDVGIPPSGPMDDLSFMLANIAVGNPSGAPGFECTLRGPTLRFTGSAVVCVAGAPTEVTIDDVPVPMWEPVSVAAGAVLDIGSASRVGLRIYLAVAGGLSAPQYHGSAATFTLGGFGGVTGKAVAEGDVVEMAHAVADVAAAPVPVEVRPLLTHEWELAVGVGPQTVPAYFTAADMEQFYRHSWRVGSHTGRTGIRLDGPKPQWSRSDGGDAGLHPSNLHDNPYSVGALNISGDTPILLGPDGPSLGGFVCPLTVVVGHRWKLGQMRPGDKVRFVPVADETAASIRRSLPERARGEVVAADPGDRGNLAVLDGHDDRPRVVYLRGGDDNVLVEYGNMALDLGVRMRIHALAGALRAQAVPGIVDVTPGVRSLHVHFDPDRLPQQRLVGLLVDLEGDLPATADLVVPSRTIRLPLSFDDPSIAEAIDRYRNGVRSEAPWLPSNIEFIRRINGLDSIDQVRATVMSAEYLVLGLGDVYLGAPLAVPLDPRHRLVTTKYNPARTWTPADAVGIGGTYLCVYGMESPGGYQLVGRTVPIWSSYRQSAPFDAGTPWLFRFFDRIVWEPVDPEELLDLREAARAGRLDVDITHGTFALSDHRAFLRDNADAIADAEERRAAAFDRERRAWVRSGEFDRAPQVRSELREPEPPEPGVSVLDGLPSDAVVVSAPMVGNVWRIDTVPGQYLLEGQPVATLEAMKLELPVLAPVTGTVVRVFVSPGATVEQGSPLVAIGAAG